jgi:hypothetical protein
MALYGIRVNGEITETSPRYAVLVDRAAALTATGTAAAVVEYLGDTQFGKLWTHTDVEYAGKKYRVVLDIQTRKYGLFAPSEFIPLIYK